MLSFSWGSIMAVTIPISRASDAERTSRPSILAAAMRKPPKIAIVKRRTKGTTNTMGIEDRSLSELAKET